MPRPITLTYTLHPAHGPQRAYLLDALTGIQAQLPLRNLHWKSPTRTSIRTIQEVDVQLVELGEMGPQREVGASVMDGALVNLCLVACDDAEVYKTSTRSFIRDWLSLLSSRRSVYAPLIVLVNPPSAKDTGKNVFGRDKGILGKLRADFNVAKRDRCVQVNLPSGNVADPAAWPEVMTRLKESIISAFDAAIMDREEEVKRGEAQRLTVGWNFCSWFLLKESLAHSFDGVGLNEDALTVYEELDATFLQILKEQNLSWFGKLGATGPRDDSLPILDVTVKPFREMLQHSAISVFDFRVYVFARQAILLGKLGRITEVAKRGQWFVASLARRLRECEADLAEHFIESWTYTACIDIVNRCDEWSRVDRPNGDYSGLIAYESARSELLDIARVQVERLGVASGHLPDRYPFSAPKGLLPESDDVLFESSDAGMSDNGETTVAQGDGDKSGRAKPSNPHFVDALSDESRFRALYLASTRKAMAAYEACGKLNSVIRLKTDLVALAMHTEDWQAAHDLARSLVRDCAEQRAWTPVHRYALSAGLWSHQNLGAEKNAEWAGYATLLMRVASEVGDVSLGEGRVHVDVNAGGAEVEGIDEEGLGAVLAGLRNLQEEYIVESHEAFSIRLESSIASVSQEGPDAMKIDICVRSQIDEDVSIDSVELMFEDADGTAIRFLTPATILQLGTNALSAICTTSTQGVLHLSSATIALGATRFRYQQLESTARLSVRRNPAGLRTALKVPRHVALDRPSRVVLHISTGECEMRDVRVRVRSLTGDAYIDLEGAESETPVECTSRHVALDSLAANQEIQITLPYKGTPQSETIHAQVVISYLAPDGGMRDFVDVIAVFIGLPLTVNVQDFFRPENMTSHFTIASDGREYLRVQSVELRGDEADGYVVESAGRKRPAVIITPERPLSSLFNISPSKSRVEQGASPNGPAVLRLVITYRNLEEEVIHRYQATGESSRSATAREASIRAHLMAVLGDKRAWLPGYAKDRVFAESSGISLGSELADNLAWQTLEIPVEVPTRRLIISARLDQPQSADIPAYEGRAIVMRLGLKVGYTWSGRAQSLWKRKQELAFDVTSNPDDWIVLGRKKGSWSASVDSDYTVDLTLVPMRAGSIALPNVSVTPMVRSRSLGRTAPRRTDEEERNPFDGEYGNRSQALEQAQEDEDEVEDELICETFLENAAEVVQVLPAKRAMTAVVPLGGQHGFGMGTGMGTGVMSVGAGVGHDHRALPPLQPQGWEGVAV